MVTMTEEERQRMISESRMIRSEDIDVIAVVDRRELKGQVCKDANLNTCAYVYEQELARWRAKRLSESEPQPQSEP